jgi:hypothetical protein
MFCFLVRCLETQRIEEEVPAGQIFSQALFSRALDGKE